MKLSMFTLYMTDKVNEGVFPLLSDAFGYFKKRGVDYGDINECEMSFYPLHTYARLMKNEGIIPRSFVADSDIASFDTVIRKRNLDKVKGYIDTMSDLGIPILMPAPSVKAAKSTDELKKMQEIMVKSLSELISYAKGSGVTVAIENQSTLQRADSKITDIRYLLDNAPGLKYIFDAGNFFCIGEDPLGAYEVLKDKLIHVHLKDWRINPFGAIVRENIPRFDGTILGNGLIPIREIIRRLKEDLYEGCTVLEINKAKIDINELDLSAQYLRGELNV